MQRRWSRETLASARQEIVLGSMPSSIRKATVMMAAAWMEETDAAKLLVAVVAQAAVVHLLAVKWL